MTRIMLPFFLVLVGKGFILLSLGETTVSVISESVDFSEDKPLILSNVENNPLFNSTETSLSSSEDLTSPKPNTELYATERSTDPTQTLIQTSKESDAVASSVTFAEVQDAPTSTDILSTRIDGNERLALESDANSTTFPENSQTLTTKFERVDESSEHSSKMVSNINDTEAHAEAIDSVALSKNSFEIQTENDKLTTITYKSSTAKRSLNSTTDNDDIEEGTTTYLSRTNVPQTRLDPISEVATTQISLESSDIKEETSDIGREKNKSPENNDSIEESSEIEKAEDTDGIFANGTSNSHRFEDPEIEKATESSKHPETNERESETLIMAGSENHLKTISLQDNQNDQSNSTVHQNGLDAVGTKMPIDSDIQVNNLEHASSEFVGVTFDPNGMTHNGPQDPDSIVFFTPDNARESEPSSNDKFSPVPAKESEEFQIVRESNSDEEKMILNGTKEFEKLEHFHPDSSTPDREDTSKTISSGNPAGSVSFENVATLPEFQIHNYTSKYSYDSEEMMQDAPQSFDASTLPENTQSKPGDSATVSEKKGIRFSSIEKTTSAVETKQDSDSSSPAVEVVSMSHLPDQSIIRPVKVKISSPSNNLIPTSVSPGSLSTQFGTLSSPVPIASVPTTGSQEVGKIESSSSDSSSPIFILPDPAPEKVVGSVEVSTMNTQPELSDSVKADQSNATIAGVAIKTSVSVNLPLSNSNNDSSQQVTNENTNSSISISSIDIPSTKGSNESSFLPTNGLTTISSATTEAPSTGFKIRKPKLKIGGGGGDRPSRQPFVPKRPAGGASTEAPPQVSIFKKSRTRIASITSSTTARPFRAFSTIRIHYATHHGMAIVPPAGEWIVSTEPVTTTTEPTTTTTEEPIEEVPFTDQTVMPVLSDSAEDVMLVKVAGYIALDRGIWWKDELDNRQTPEYKKNEEIMLMHLERLFRSSSIAPRLWKIEIDGFSGSNSVRPVGVDFFLYLIKSNPIFPEHLESVFRERLTQNRTFGTYRVDTDKTAFEVLQEEPLVKATPPPDDDEEVEPPIPQWAIACIVIGAASLIFIVLFAAVTLYGRHHMRRRYSNKLSEEGERSSGEWESKMAAAYENMAADTLYDADENTYKKQASSRIATFHGIPSPLQRGDSWSSARRTPRWTSHFD